MEPLKYRNFFVKCPYCHAKRKVSFEGYEDLIYCPKCTHPYSYDRHRGARKAKVYNLFCYLFAIAVLVCIPIMIMTAIHFGVLARVWVATVVLAVAVFHALVRVLVPVRALEVDGSRLFNVDCVGKMLRYYKLAINLI